MKNFMSLFDFKIKDKIKELLECCSEVNNKKNYPHVFHIKLANVMIGFILARKFCTMVKVTDNEKHSSLLPFIINYNCKKLYISGHFLHWNTTLMKGSILARKCYTMVKVTNNEKHSSLLPYIINYDHKKLYHSGCFILGLHSNDRL
jgi:hypothetical protein